MRFLRRPPRSTLGQALPSIHTAFPTNYEKNSKTPSNEGSPYTIPIERSNTSCGKEVVPIERSNTTCAKMVSPGTEEKECVLKSSLELHIAAKPLPRVPNPRREPPPRSRWSRLPVIQRVVILVGIQLGLLLIIFAGLMSIKGGPLNRNQSNEGEHPSNSPPIKLGTYTLALGSARQQSSACLANSNESAAWACTDGGSLRIDISASPFKRGANELISLASISNPSQTVYGQQPPEVAPTELFPFVDTVVSGPKPIFSFKTTYNRTVYLPDSQLPQAGVPSSSTIHDEGATMNPSDRPWLCFFNDTIIEGFIYAPQNTTFLAPVDDSGASRASRFPFIVRLNEQRFPNGTQPYCQRQRVSDNGQLVSDGTKRFLSFSEPTFFFAAAKRYMAFSAQHKRQSTTPTNACRCEWICKHTNYNV
ncbi:hypothetical protein K458DRAFT_319517 [Lentithecium fluviatile CBS 122367]|uniref:DUF7820 domain-containing protein n=1 Tax=Lentithecium fluviatile CBS 122367 TaxID=1168545 RepID=A0A6G1IHP9_9PLEO|nr:hypothetical protein K458DRAFT_319517 [Lentithecium fluviatile CBS 122367]